MNNWFDHILFHTRTQPETSAIVMEDRVVTYGMLGIAIENCARRIAALDIDRDGIVAVLVHNPIRDLTLSLALFRIGIRSMSLAAGQAGIAELKFAAVIADASAKQMLDPANRFIEATDAWFGMEPVGGGRLPAHFSGSRQVCRQSLTSGTTGAPKLIGNTLGYIGRHIVPGITQFNCNLVLSMPGLTSTWGFMVACAVLASRKTLCLAESPYQAVRMIELFSIDFVLTSTDQFVSLVRAARKTGAHLHSLRTVVTGGGIPSRALLEGAAVYLCKDVRCRYGTSELGLVAETAASEVLSKPGFVGYIQPGFEIGVFDVNGGPLPDGQIGIVKGRLGADQIDYLPGGNADDNPWIDHGDVGWMTPDGQLFIVGRTSDIPAASFRDASARDVSPVHEVEHLLRLEWDAADAAAILVDNSACATPEIWVGIVDCKDARVDKLAAILRQRGLDGEVRLFPLPSIPRGANGKVQRGPLKSSMLAAADRR